jgi:chemotaxis regulatin CheY-phosphate phosphatase CheZ
MEDQVADPAAGDLMLKKISDLRNEVNGSHDDLFSIMNALQFQDITTQQINSIGSVIDTVQAKLYELLMGFDEERITLNIEKSESLDLNAEFDFDRSAESQRFIDEIIKQKKKGLDMNTGNLDSLVDKNPNNQDSGPGNTLIP